jgi:hypothetical protein
MYSNVGVLVDGRAEELFFRATLPGCRIRRNIPNGRDVSLDLIFDAIQIGHETFSGAVDTVIVKIDREQRAESFEAIVQALEQKILNAGIIRPTILALADRCLENWILADDVQISEICGADYDYIHEGAMGKSILMNALQANAKLPYVKTSKLLISASPNNIRANSQSFAHFADAIDFDWHWLNPPPLQA